MIGQLVPGGSEKMTLQLADQLRRAGHDHRVVVLGELDDAFVRSVGASSVPLYRIPLGDKGARSGLRAIRALAGIARRNGVDVLQGHAWRSSIAVGLAGVLAGVPAIATLHRVYYPAVERVLDRGLQKLWQGVVVDSEAVGDLLVSEVGIDQARVTVIPNFVAPHLFERAGAERRGGADHMVMLMAAHFTPVKGHRFALDALAQLERSAPGGAVLDMLGEGPLLDDCRQLAAELGVGHLARFHGRRSDLAAWLHRSDVVLLPSLWEGFGLVLAEGMACGKPAVSFRIGGASEVIVDGQTGFLTPPGDVRSLAAALERLRDEPVLREQMGRAGRERAARLFTLDRALTLYETLYEGVARR